MQLSWLGPVFKLFTLVLQWFIPYKQGKDKAYLEQARSDNEILKQYEKIEAQPDTSDDAYTWFSDTNRMRSNRK